AKKGDDSCPQIFVVDQPTNNTQQPVRQKPLWKRARKNLLLPLFGLVMFGLALEGVFIYRLHKRTEVRPVPVFKTVRCNLANVPTSLKSLSACGQKHFNAFILIVGSNSSDKDGVVQWLKNSDSFTSNIEYNSSGLLIKTDGFYYLYSKVHFSQAEDCVMVNHMVMRNTTAYGLPIELMKSKSFHCRNERPNQKRTMEPDLWNSFLAGIFKLETGDHIFVMLDRGLHAGPADNFFGAFKII
uniref:THD domain-containing protein n=1 Tax=Periophthalmus magnuspinnatus TaxID=409849 RepID=A0A3B4BHD1_9GOBI